MTLHSELPTRAISLYAPWAWAILHAGKDIENRSLRFPRFTGRLWLHCSLFGKSAEQMRKKAWEMIDILVVSDIDGWWERAPAVPTEDLQAMRGHIVGHVEVTGRVTESDSPWFVGPAGLTLASPVALRSPVPCKGALGIWSTGSVQSQLAEAAQEVCP